MKDALRGLIDEHVVNKTEGGTSEGIMEMLDYAIDMGYISEEEYNANEVQILNYIDSHIFECTGCGWTQPVSQMGQDVDGEFRCEDCD